MNEFITMHIDPVLEVVSLCFGILGIIVISWYTVYSLSILYRTHNFKHTRQIVGEGILLGLEYIVAGDVIRTIIMPYYYQLGILAGLVIIRTILSYFLNKELHS